jgi:hypothetical protein
LLESNIESLKDQVNTNVQQVNTFYEAEQKILKFVKITNLTFIKISTILEEKRKFEGEMENLKIENERLKKLESELKDSATTTTKSNKKGRNLQVI